MSKLGLFSNGLKFESKNLTYHKKVIIFFSLIEKVEGGMDPITANPTRRSRGVMSAATWWKPHM